MLVIKFRKKAHQDLGSPLVQVQVFAGSTEATHTHPDAITVGLCGEIVMASHEWAALDERLKVDAFSGDKTSGVAFRIGRD